MPALGKQRGLSLIEVTIMLLVLMLLTSVLAPSIFDFVKDAQWVKVKEDCEAIAISIARLTKDVGPCVKMNGALPCTKANRADVLVSDGNFPTVGVPPFIPFPANTINTLNWPTGPGGQVDTLERQLITNGPGYPEAQGPPFGPFFGQGWRGAYLAPPIGSDPWGRTYQVNTGFLAVATDVPCVIISPSFMCAQPGEGQTGGNWNRDVFCISAGPNGIIETPFGGNATFGVTRGGDDHVTVLGGTTK